MVIIVDTGSVSIDQGDFPTSHFTMYQTTFSMECNLQVFGLTSRGGASLMVGTPLGSGGIF